MRIFKLPIVNVSYVNTVLTKQNASIICINTQIEGNINKTRQA